MAILGVCLMVLVGMSPSLSAAPSVTVKQIRFHEGNAQTQVLVDLSATPKDVAVNDAVGGPMTIAFPGVMSGKSTTLNRKFSWPNLNNVYIENRNGRVQIFIKRNITGTVSVKTTGNRLAITIPHYYYSPNNQHVISDGVNFTRLIERGPQGSVHISVLEVDPQKPNLEILPALATRHMRGKTPVSSMVSQYQAVAGINGSFFKPDVGIPLGILIINQELITGPIYDRVALGITSTNEVKMARVQLGGEVVLPQGKLLRVHNINQPRVRAADTVVYSSRWGTKAPGVPANGMQVQIKNNVVTAVSTSGALPIPSDGVVVSGPKTPEMVLLASMPKHQQVPLNVYTLPDWSGMKHAIGGGPWLIKNGQVFVDLAAQNFTSKSLGFREPRSAVGVTRDGKLLLVAVDGRHKMSVGMTMYELAGLMHRLGAVQAMNLDGGSSTQMAIHGRTVNLPSAGNVGVSNSLIVRKTGDGHVAVGPELQLLP